MYDYRTIWDEELARAGHPAAAGATATGRAAVAAMQRAFDLGYQAAGGIVTPIIAAPNPSTHGCNCGFAGLRHTPSCRVYPLTAEGGFAGAYPPGGGDDDSDE